MTPGRGRGRGLGERVVQGRANEQCRIRRMLADARRGESNCLLLHGEAGIGKTTLLDYAVAHAEGASVLRVEGIESEMELAFGGLHQLLLPVLDRLDLLPPPQAGALRAVFGLSEETVRDRLTIGLATLSLLSEAAAGQPLLCVVDDLQWLDRPSVDALVFAARRLRAEGVVMLFATRETSSVGGAKSLPHVPVTGVDRESAASMLPGLAPPVTEWIIDQAQGNPLALQELAAALTPAQRAGQLGPLTLPDARSAPPNRLRDAFAEQIRRLPDATRRMLTVAAADDTGDLPTVLAAAAGLGGEVGDLEPAERAELVLVSAQRLRFRHPLIRFAAYQCAPLAWRLAVHQALVAVLDGPAHAHRRAWHLAAAATGPDERVAGELERVAEWAGSRQAMASASAAYERAAHLTADTSRRARRLINAAQKASEAGQDERCRALTDQVPLPLPDPGMAADFARARSVVELGYGSPGQAARLLAECTETVSASRPDKLAPLLTDAIHAAFSAGDAALMMEIAVRTPGLPVVATPAKLLAGDIPGALRTLDEHVEAACLDGSGLMDRLMAGIYCHLVADHENAYELATAAVTHCREQGIGGWLPTTLHLLAQAELALGRHEDAHAHAAEALRLAEAYDLDHRAAHLRALLAVLAAVRGEEEATRELAVLALEYTRPRDVGRGTADALWALGLLDLGLGRAQDALEHLEAARHAVGHPILTRHLMPDLIEAAVRAGHPERAREPAKQLMSWADDLRQPHFTAQAHRCAALTGPDASAEEHYTSALDPHNGGGDFERARTELLYGEWLRRGRRKLDARGHLRTARELFDRLGAQPWARRAATELQAAGETSHPADAVDSPISRLSSQEREVVRLAATGATNREIATRLFLSPRTVGHHLYRAFPKLGISSRTELADLLAS
ncbi:AAA family ATPase [Streptomyces sp. NBC_01005]|uniref:ATP-binding protein n=1 Tax=unclassified Streptomyces TaxID=2593676 RepID=UPI003867D2FB|nr:AAA family ATPase [Streptomyces sp. NBC_01005]WTC93861.1 AAA family ATPase [Streptomyces sp. NBC_01650]